MPQEAIRDLPVKGSERNFVVPGKNLRPSRGNQTAHPIPDGLRYSMASETRGWEALCYAAATENDPEKLQDIIVELNVLLDARQEELQRKRTTDSHLPTDRFGRWHN